MDDDVIIVGAGAGGLCCAVALEARGVPATVLERSAVGESWRRRPDGLRLNSGRKVSALPGQRFPRGVGSFPGRDDVVDYLDRYAGRCRVRTGVTVDRVEPEGPDHWRLTTSVGPLHTRHVILATGQFSRPVLPAWPGRDEYRGRLVHAAAYRNAEPYRDDDVLVVGSGSSGVEIAAELARSNARGVRLSVRTPPNLVPRAVGALPGIRLLLRLPPSVGDAQLRLVQRLAIGDLDEYGLPRPAAGPFTQLKDRGVDPTAVDRATLRAIRERRITVVPAVVGLDAEGARLADGSHVRVDTVIAATGFRPDLDDLVGGLGVLDEGGYPVSGEALPRGLHFIGYDRVPGPLVFLPSQARRVAARISADVGAKSVAAR